MRKYVALAFLAHFAAVILMLLLHPTLIFTPDTLTYLQPARDILDNGVFASPWRLPGYSLVLTASIVLTGDERAALFVAPPLAALACYALMQLAAHLHPRAVALTGILFAFYPGSLVLAGLLMTDAIGAYLVVVAVWAVIEALNNKQWMLLVAAAALLGGEILRPPLSFSGLFVFALALVVSRSRAQWRRTLVLILVTLPLPLLFSLINLGTYGVFTISLLSTETMREYLYTHVETHDDDRAALALMPAIRVENDIAAQARLNCQLTNYYGCKHEIQAQQMEAIAQQYGYGAVLRAMLLQAREQLSSGNVYFFYSVLVDLLLMLYWLALLILSFVGTYRLLKRRNLLPLALWLIFAYFLVTGATSAWVYARLRFPGDLLILPLAAVALVRRK